MTLQVMADTLHHPLFKEATTRCKHSARGQVCTLNQRLCSSARAAASALCAAPCVRPLTSEHSVVMSRLATAGACGTLARMPGSSGPGPAASQVQGMLSCQMVSACVYWHKQHC